MNLNIIPQYFINENGLSEELCYGKFEVEKVVDFLKLLIKSGITIVNVIFTNYDDRF